MPKRNYRGKDKLFFIDKNIFMPTKLYPEGLCDNGPRRSISKKKAVKEEEMQ